jgi:hypothetical protein
LRELPKENLEQIVKVAQEIIKEKKNAQKSWWNCRCFIIRQ